MSLDPPEPPCTVEKGDPPPGHDPSRYTGGHITCTQGFNEVNFVSGGDPIVGVDIPEGWNCPVSSTKKLECTNFGLFPLKAWFTVGFDPLAPVGLEVEVKSLGVIYAP